MYRVYWLQSQLYTILLQATKRSSVNLKLFIKWHLLNLESWLRFRQESWKKKRCLILISSLMFIVTKLSEYKLVTKIMKTLALLCKNAFFLDIRFLKILIISHIKIYHFWDIFKGTFWDKLCYDMSIFCSILDFSFFFSFLISERWKIWPWSIVTVVPP